MPFLGLISHNAGLALNITGRQQTGTFDHVLSIVDGRDYGWWDHSGMIGGEKEIVIS